MSNMQDRGQASLSDRILTEVPRLRVYARMMTNDISIADRGVAETLQDALSDVERLRACQDLQIHLFMILRAILVSDETALGKFKGLLLIENEHIETPISLATALLSLTFESREAVVLRAGLNSLGRKRRQSSAANRIYTTSEFAEVSRALRNFCRRRCLRKRLAMPCPAALAPRSIRLSNHK